MGATIRRCGAVAVATVVVATTVVLAALAPPAGAIDTAMVPPGDPWLVTGVTDGDSTSPRERSVSLCG